MNVKFSILIMPNINHAKINSGAQQDLFARLAKSHFIQKFGL